MRRHQNKRGCGGINTREAGQLARHVTGTHDHGPIRPIETMTKEHYGRWTLGPEACESPEAGRLKGRLPWRAVLSTVYSVRRASWTYEVSNILFKKCQVTEKTWPKQGRQSQGSSTSSAATRTVSRSSCWAAVSVSRRAIYTGEKQRSGIESRALLWCRVLLWSRTRERGRKAPAPAACAGWSCGAASGRHADPTALATVQT